MLRRNSPQQPFIADDLHRVQASVQTLLQEQPFHLLFGHGKPADGLSLLRTYGPLTRTTHPEETRS